MLPYNHCWVDDHGVHYNFFCTLCDCPYYGSNDVGCCSLTIFDLCDEPDDGLCSCLRAFDCDNCENIFCPKHLHFNSK